MIQITPQMRVVVAVEPVDFRKGIDGLARLCQEVLQHDPLRGWVRWWPTSGSQAATTLCAHQLPVLLSAGDPTAARAASGVASGRSG